LGDKEGGLVIFDKEMRAKSLMAEESISNLEEVKITTTYIYLGVQFLGPRFGLRKAIQP